MSAAIFSLGVSEVTSIFKAISMTHFYLHTLGAEHRHRDKVWDISLATEAFFTVNANFKHEDTIKKISPIARTETRR